MWVGYEKDLDPGGQIARSLVWFDIASLLPGIEITSAQLWSKAARPRGLEL